MYTQLVYAVSLISLATAASTKHCVQPKSEVNPASFPVLTAIPSDLLSRASASASTSASASPATATSSKIPVDTDPYGPNGLDCDPNAPIGDARACLRSGKLKLKRHDDHDDNDHDSESVCLYDQNCWTYGGVVFCVDSKTGEYFDSNDGAGNMFLGMYIPASGQETSLPIGSLPTASPTATTAMNDPATTTTRSTPSASTSTGAQTTTAEDAARGLRVQAAVLGAAALPMLAAAL